MNVQYTLCRTLSSRTLACRTTPEPGYAARGLCPRCEHDAQTAIDALPDDYGAVLDLVWDKPTSAGPATGVFGPSEPVNLAADGLAGEIRYAAVQWGEIVADRAHLDEPVGVWDSARILGTHFTALISTPEIAVSGYDRSLGYLDGVDAAVWLTVLHRRAVAHVGIVTRVRRLPGLCPTCHAPTLDHNNGADLVRCARCRTCWTWTEYDLHVQLTTWGSVA